MDKIIEEILKLSQCSKYIKLYLNEDKKNFYKNIAKIPGEVDEEYKKFLLLTNGALILDYCFLGLKNNKLGINVYDNMKELWVMDNLLATLDKRNEQGSHFIGYYSRENIGKVYLVASSFLIFMRKFLYQIKLMYSIFT